MLDLPYIMSKDWLKVSLDESESANDMIADFFTKLLNGAKFRKFRNLIMNCAYDEMGPVEEGPELNVINDPAGPKTYKDALTGSQECVGYNRVATSTSGKRAYVSDAESADVRKKRNSYQPTKQSDRLANGNTSRAPISAE